MSIITKPLSIQKNVAATISLSKSELASEIADVYYADSTNWKEVIIHYKSSTGNQRKILKFDATQSSPQSTFLASLKSKDIFQVQKIVIVDFDNGSITVPRSQLTVADFDVTLSGGSPASSVVWNFVSRPAYSLNAQSEITSSLTVLSYDTSTILFSLSEYTIPANGLELKMVANNGWAIEDAHFFGVCDPSETVFNGFYYDANTGIPSFGVNNILQFPYTHPATPEVEFKIIIKTTQTEFYVNGILQPTQPPLAPVSNGSPTIKVATRFDNDINIKSCTIVEL